jgi:hypothetical protein
VFEKISTQREKVAGGWRRVHSDELHNMCSSPSIIRAIESRTMKWAGYVCDISPMGEMRNVYKILVGKPEGKGLLGRSNSR